MRLVTEAQYLEKVKMGKWIWVYDNLNYYRWVRHERKGNCAMYISPHVHAHMIYMYMYMYFYQAQAHIQIMYVITLITDKHSSMLNVTTRLAIKMHNVPDWDVDWLDNKPQLPRSALNYTHFIPNEADAECLEKYAVQFMMEFLVENFTSLKHLSHLVPPRQSPHPIQKSTVYQSMKVLFRDEKYTAETIEILAQLTHDARLTGESPQVSKQQLK